jgi:uncharacterized protein (DUF2126 family)
LPVNAYEAEGRRVSRFTVLEHTPDNIKSPKKSANKAVKQMEPPTELINREYPFTLDLRWHAS